ncbi:MAG: MaoC family dehydratase [Thermincola sp.]|jgi:3-hydroxybutyryl-CoA dehydratase|nr:MaoC family dehydratase [Thermincola sp.]MDT3702245.1 MaoC family dehydratase [Thermincola sp.]
MGEEKSRSFAELAVGDKASVEKTVTEQDVNLFAEVSGDYNPVHVDEAFAQTTRFKKRIAHGMLAASLVSRVIGTKLPGPGTIYLSQTLNFKAPVYLGDTITTEVEITEKITARNFVKLKTICSNQEGTVVLDGEALVLYGK